MRTFIIASVAAGVGMGVGGRVASAGIGFDSITGQTSGAGFNFGATEVAQDTTLSAASGLMVTGVTVRMWNNSFTSPVNANVRVSVYESVGGVSGGLPGALLTTGLVHLTMGLSTVGMNSITDMYVDVPDATASSRWLWTSYQIMPIDQPAIYPNPMIMGLPTVGSGGRGLAHFLSGAWSPSGTTTVSTSLGMQVQTIPGPSGAGALGAGVGVGVGVLGLRRRRGRVG